MILSAQTKIQRLLFFGLGLTGHHPRNVKRELPSQPRPISISVFFFSPTNFIYLYFKIWEILRIFFCFSGVKLSKFSFFGGEFRQTFDILKIWGEKKMLL
jgi:hypothetical protein